MNSTKKKKKNSKKKNPQAFSINKKNYEAHGFKFYSISICMNIYGKKPK